MKISSLFLLLFLLFGSCAAQNIEPVAMAGEPIIGGPCEGCENVFKGIPADIKSVSRIAPEGEKGEALVVEGTVRNAEGNSVEGIIIYAYQTDAGGIYPKSDTRHGALRGWIKTDKDGSFRFDTIRPGSYPNTRNPQHIHLHVIEPGKATYYIDDIMFDDDPLLTREARQQMNRGRGGPGIAHPERDDEGVWHVRRDIILGKEISGYN